MQNFHSYDELRDIVNNNGDLITVPLMQLRDVLNVSKLGVHVRNDIKKGLDSCGLKVFPPELPNNQHDLVRVYRAGSPIADLIDAVLNPTPEHDTELKNTVRSEDRDIINQIKRIVCD